MSYKWLKRQKQETLLRQKYPTPISSGVNGVGQSFIQTDICASLASCQAVAVRRSLGPSTVWTLASSQKLSADGGWDWEEEQIKGSSDTPPSPEVCLQGTNPNLMAGIASQTLISTPKAILPFTHNQIVCYVFFKKKNKKLYSAHMALPHE